MIVRSISWAKVGSLMDPKGVGQGFMGEGLVGQAQPLLL